MHGLVPRLLLRGGVHGRLAGIGAVACAGVGVHDLAGAGRIVARRGIGCAVPALAVPLLTVAVASGIGRIAGFIAAGRRLASDTGPRAAGILGCVAAVTGIVVPRLRQAVVCLLDEQISNLPARGPLAEDFRARRRRRPFRAVPEGGCRTRRREASLHLPAWRPRAFRAG